MYFGRSSLPPAGDEDEILRQGHLGHLTEHEEAVLAALKEQVSVEDLDLVIYIP